MASASRWGIGLRKWGLRLSLLVLVVGGGGGAAFYSWLKTSLPKLEGEVWVKGLDKEVRVFRDENGIPTIRGQSKRDAYFGLGFVHAQDRMWQMERNRRIGAGRLAEILGPEALRVDKFMRTIGIYRKAEETFAKLDPEVRRHIEAYAAGVNAWIAAQEGALPPEFVAIGHRPEPWKPADSLVWGRLMALRLSGNWHDELLRAGLLKRDGFDPAMLDDLWQGAPVDLPAAAPPSADAAALGGILAALPADLRPTTASNVWALAPSRTDTGNALLANDPHLDLDAPILWYLAQVIAPDLHVTGGTIPGVPFHLIGHNDSIAWGMTTTTSDTQDLFIERVLDGGTTYAAPGGPRPFEVRTEVITVKGGDPVTLTVRQSRHGPIVSDLVPAPIDKDQALALSAVAVLEDNFAGQALYKMNTARDWPSFVEALRDFHGPQQNIFYADTSMNIGFYSPAKVPVRGKGNGMLPVPGWDKDYDWTGWVPFEELPQAFNPPDGVLVNANNKIVGPDYPHMLAAEWPDVYRAQRIRELIDAYPRHVSQSMTAIQMDRQSPIVAELKPLLLNFEPASNPTQARQAASMIETWDGIMDRKMAEPLIFSVWVNEAERAVFGDEMGPLFEQWSRLHPRALTLALTRKPKWCDDVTTTRKEGCREQLGLALDRALTWISDTQGSDMAQWSWGRAHKATFRHTLFQYVPVLDHLTELSIESDGGEFTVNRGTFEPRADKKTPYAHIHGAGLRVVYDMAEPASSRFIIATGQSGNPLSPYYATFLEKWRDGRTIRIASDGKAELRLLPLPPPIPIPGR